MTSDVPDGSQSRVVLIGTSQFAYLPELPSVQRNLADLHRCLTDPTIWGAPTENVDLVANPRSIPELLDPIHAAAADATDTLLVYYSGHGLVDPWNGELALALTESIPGKPHTATPYDWVRRVVVDGKALRKIVILDCCFSGRALGIMADPAGSIADQASAQGTFVLASASENEAALSPPGEPHTAFTGELLALLRSGIPGGPQLLGLDLVYRLIRESLRSKSRPVPQQRNRNTAGNLSLFRNRAWQPSSAPVRRLEETRVANRYRLIDQIGEGTTAKVYKAFDERLSRTVAVKMLRPEMSYSDAFVQRFLREGRTSARIVHPCVASVYDVVQHKGAHDSQPCLIMEYLPGDDLADRLDQGPMSTRDVTTIGQQVCTGLSAGHAAGIVHRDIKPSNIMLVEGGQVKILDFGIALVGSEAESTHLDPLAGTIQYMAPEQIAGHPTDPRTDIYSLGCVIYKMLTGRPPFVADTPVAIAMKHLNEPPTPIPGPLWPAVARALAKNPADRQQTAADLRRGLLDDDWSRL